MAEIKARVHSLESFGTVDGPGVRMVVFMQGCPMRCLYCHNPDTWGIEGGTEMTVDEILAQYDRNVSFYKRGGITVTGGEPLLQMDFVIELYPILGFGNRLDLHRFQSSGIRKYYFSFESNYE